MARSTQPPRDTSRWNESGFLRVGRWRGAPILLHWSIPFGLYVLDGMRVLPGYWLAGTLLIFAHEMGHALLALRNGARVTAVKVMPIGGLCEYEGDLTEVQHARVAWGGVLAQAVLYALTLLALRLFGAPTHPWAAQAVTALTEANTFLITLNLMPVRPLDGYEAWRLPMRWLQSIAQRAENEKLQRQIAAMRARGPRVVVVEAPPAPVEAPAVEAPVVEAPINDEARALAEQMWSAARERDS